MQHVCFCSDIIMFGFLRVFLFGNGTHCIVAAFRIWSRWWLLNTIELSSTSILSDWLGRRGYIGTLAISCYVWLFCKKTSQKCEKLFQVRNEWIQLECLDAGWKKYISIYIYIWCERSSKDPYFELQGCSSRSWGKSPWSLLDRRLETAASETGEWLHPSQVGHRDPTYPGWVQTDAGWEKFPKDIRTYIYTYIHIVSYLHTYTWFIITSSHFKLFFKEFTPNKEIIAAGHFWSDPNKGTLGTLALIRLCSVRWKISQKHWQLFSSGEFWYPSSFQLMST